jgi:hypothetical protein
MLVHIRLGLRAGFLGRRLKTRRRKVLKDKGVSWPSRAGRLLRLMGAGVVVTSVGRHVLGPQCGPRDPGPETLEKPSRSGALCLLWKADYATEVHSQRSVGSGRKCLVQLRDLLGCEKARRVTVQ